MIKTSKITQANKISGINITNLSNNATINITPFTNLKTLNAFSANNNISSTQLNFNNFSNIKLFSSEASARSSSNPAISFNVNGTNSSVENYIAQSAKVTSLVLKNPKYNSSLTLNTGEIPTGLTFFNIEGNSLPAQDLASILISFSGMASSNNITGGNLNVISYNNIAGAPSLTSHFTNLSSNYRETWSSDNGQYQLAVAAVASEVGQQGFIRYSNNYGASFSTIFDTNSWRGIAASNDITKIVAVARSGQAVFSNNLGFNSTPINTVLTNNQPQNYNDVAMSSNGQYINLTVNGDNNFDSTGALYCSNDYGATFTKGGGGIGAYQYTKWVATDISSNGQYQIACAKGGAYPYLVKSSNYGVTWTIELVADALSEVAMSSDGKYQTAIGKYIWTSSDYGANWRLAYIDYTIVNSWWGGYGIRNEDFNGGVSISSDGKNQIVGLTTVKEYVPVAYYPYSVLQDRPGYLITSSNYGATWQRTAYRDYWGSCNISPNAPFMIAGSNNGYLYTSRSDGADLTYGTYLPIVYQAVTYLRDVKDWTVRFILGFFDI